MSVIAVHGDDLLGLTSSTPSRDVLLRLIALRPRDRFIFVLWKGSEQTKAWKTFNEQLSELSNHEAVILPRSRRFANLLNLIRGYVPPKAPDGVNLLLRFDAGGFCCASGAPLISLVADLSVFQTPSTTSLKWHGHLLFKRGFDYACEHSRKIVCVSAHTLKSVAAMRPSAGKRLALIHNGISDHWFHHKATVPADKRFILWFGAMNARKNLRGLVEGYARAATDADFPDLTLVGQGPELSALKALVGERSISHRVCILPPQRLDRLIALVDESVGVALPSFHEGFGMPVVEAYARGRPVLVSTAGALQEVSGGLAVTCRPDDVESIASGLRVLASSTYSSAQHQQVIRSYAAKFSIESAAVKYNKLIASVLEGTKSGI